MKWVFFIIWFFVVFDLGFWVSGNVVFQVQHKFTGNNKRDLNAYKVHDFLRHRRILSAVDLPLGGDDSPSAAALYYTKIQIGTPPRDYHVQVDTGSDLLWVNCAGCQSCPKKSDLGAHRASKLKMKKLGECMMLVLMIFRGRVVPIGRFSFGSCLY